MKAAPDAAAPRSSLLLRACWAIALGLLSGFACVLTRLVFLFLQRIFTGHDGLLPHAAAALTPAHRVLVPVAGAFCAWAFMRARQRQNQSPPFVEYVEAVRRHEGVIPFSSTLWRTVSSAFSIGSGATIGHEGSMIQFATAATSWIGARAISYPRLHKLTSSFTLPQQVACGAAAAVGAVYQAPVAGVFFASEIVLGGAPLSYYPLLALASCTGWLISRETLEAGPLFPAAAPLGALHAECWWLLPMCLVLAAVSPGYQWLIRSMHWASKLPVALAWGGLAVGLLSILRPEVWGNGDQALVGIMRASSTYLPGLGAALAIFGIRLFATTFCVGVGTVGGVFTPTLFTGASIGLIAAHLAHTSAPLVFIIIAMGALLAGVTHAPLMATFMAAEVTGACELVPLLLLSNLITWQVSRSISPRSLYSIATNAPGRSRDSESHGRPPSAGPRDSQAD